MVFDIDDTLWYSVDAPDAIKRFGRLEGDRVADHVGYAQQLVPNAREVLDILKDKGYILAIATMGPEEQVRSFMKGFGIADYFNFEISAFMREDKGEKIAKILEGVNKITNVAPGELVYADDNLGYLNAAKKRFPEIKCVLAWSFKQDMKTLNEALQEEHGITLW
ncbi:MAG: HAD family hydrolase [Candidatus Hodarchaeota archaeon]